MKCPYCGANYENAFAFCPYCGGSNPALAPEDDTYEEYCSFVRSDQRPLMALPTYICKAVFQGRSIAQIERSENERRMFYRDMGFAGNDGYGLDQWWIALEQALAESLRDDGWTEVVVNNSHISGMKRKVNRRRP